MDCHAPFVWFGYELHLPPELNRCTSIPLLYDLNGMIQAPFEIRSLLPCFPPDIDSATITEGMVCVVIGFAPTTARETYHRSKELAAYVVDNPILNGFTVANDAMFHCGIEWYPEIDDEELDESDESVSDSESEL